MTDKYILYGRNVFLGLFSRSGQRKYEENTCIHFYSIPLLRPLYSDRTNLKGKKDVS
jgi:hypothetical protein